MPEDENVQMCNEFNNHHTAPYQHTAKLMVVFLNTLATIQNIFAVA